MERPPKGTNAPPPGCVEVLRYECRNGEWYRIERFTTEDEKASVVTRVLVSASEAAGALANADPLGWFHGYMKTRGRGPDDWEST